MKGSSLVSPGTAAYQAYVGGSSANYNARPNRPINLVELDLLCALRRRRHGVFRSIGRHSVCADKVRRDAAQYDRLVLGEREYGWRDFAD